MMTRGLDKGEAYVIKVGAEMNQAGQEPEGSLLRRNLPDLCHHLRLLLTFYTLSCPQGSMAACIH